MAIGVAVELGFRIFSKRRATLAARRAKLKGSRARSYAPFVDTPFESQYWWIIILRLWTTLAIVVLNTALVWRTPTIASAVMLFTTTQSMLLLLTVATLMCCPYRRSDRWNIVASLCTLALTTLSALANLLVVLCTTRIPGAEDALKGVATTILVLLGLAFVVSFIAFLFTHALGVCKLCGCKCDHCESSTPQREEAGDDASGIEMNPLSIARAAKAAAAETAAAAAGGVVAGAVKEDTVRPVAKKKKKKKEPPRAASSASNELVRWKKKKRSGASFAETLFTIHPDDGGDGNGAGTIPPHLASLFNKIFTLADSDGDGNLSTMELIRVIKKRAKGSTLNGNAHAIFTLKTQLQKAGGGDDEDADLGVERFAQGMMEVVRSAPEGPVAQWILSELQAEANAWSTHTHLKDGREYFVHDTTAARQWTKPTIVAVMEWCAQTVASDHPGSASARSAEGRESAQSGAGVELDDGALPRGWKAHEDATSGRSFFQNEYAGTTSWKKPTLPAPPAGWTVHPHAERTQYYHNASTGATLWIHPNDVADDGALPRGWKAHVDATSGRSFFQNEYAGTTSWKRPTLPAPPAGWTVHPHAERTQYYHNASTGVTLWTHPPTEVVNDVEESTSSEEAY